LGAWRYAAFGLLLMLTLRFAQNGLVYPILKRLSPQRVRPAPVTRQPEATEAEAS